MDERVNGREVDVASGVGPEGLFLVVPSRTVAAVRERVAECFRVTPSSWA